MQHGDSSTQREFASAGDSSLLPVFCDRAAPDFLFADGRMISLAEAADYAAAIAAVLPFEPAAHSSASPPAMINLCEDRCHFLLAYAAALGMGHLTLLPASRAPAVIAELESSYERTYRFDDAAVSAVKLKLTAARSSWKSAVSGAGICMIGFTSGSTGRSKGYPKRWSSVSTTTALNQRSIRAALKLPANGSTPWIVATVPPQHMYGMEFSVLLPMLGGMAVHGARPLFPLDVAQALEQVPAPRILVTTPVHLRALVESGVALPSLAGVISATAPLDKTLAIQAERHLNAVLFEMFGSTETCILATRQTAREDAWSLYPGVGITPRPDGALVTSPWLVEPMSLQDIVELLPGGRFIVRGRNTDFIDVAGKRASLAELTRRLMAVPGVQDAVVFPPEQSASGQARRVAALVVAPGLDTRTVLSRLSDSVDPAFLPRPLVMVDRLPRNETGKLPREQLLACLANVPIV